MATEGFDWEVDGSDATYADRLQHYRKSLGVRSAPFSQRIELNNAAHELATEEMLTEIHAMLRFLVKAQSK